ncbi:unnamed protein product [Chilo suppressalis]|uniref:Lipase n=1 Tax=Chilo suppressalis TaxID=168631 RepID=A0ABN8B3F9_CHISP|nr:unnamed protein product [Chilo suppressalis]
MYRVVFLLFWSALRCVICDNNYEDAKLNFTQLAVKYGQKCEEFDVTTKDGYILKLFHIVGNESNPIILAHGMTDSADTFIIRGELSLAITLAKKGCDVWALNVRGNKYSRRHETLNPDKDKEFWNYSFHEMGLTDLPAIIDFVLNNTGQSQLTIIGHSQGNQMSLVLTSLFTEYNSKIKAIIALGPVAFMHNVRFPLSALIPLWPSINIVLKASGQEEIFKNGTLPTYAARNVCTQKEIGYKLCGQRVLFPIVGPDPDELEPEFFPIMFEHFPTTTSRKNFDHCAQISLKKRFAQFDYGLDNLKVYGSLVPAEYPLSNITTRVALLVGLNDPLADVTDVKILRDKLPNSYYYEIKREQCNHADFVIGKNMNDYLYPIVFEILQNYRKINFNN